MVAFTTYAMPDYLLYLIGIQIFALSFSLLGFKVAPSTSSTTAASACSPTTAWATRTTRC